MYQSCMLYKLRVHCVYSQTIAKDKLIAKTLYIIDYSIQCINIQLEGAD